MPIFTKERFEHMKRIFAFILCIAMVASLATLYPSAVPYVPPTMAWKDFGQKHNYVYEITKGNAAPKIDGYVRESDNYGEPVATYSIRYCVTSGNEVYEENFKLRPEYKMRTDGDNAGNYYCYPTPDSPQEVWNSISSIETTTDSGYVITTYVKATTWSATTSYYYFREDTGAFTRAYPPKNYTTENWNKNCLTDCLIYNSSGDPVYGYDLLTTQPEDWETKYTSYYTLGYTSATTMAKVYSRVTGSTAPEFKPNTYYRLGTATNGGKQIHTNQLYITSEGATTQPATVARMKADHVILPEEIKVYARYDSTYLYQAWEVVESNRKKAPYHFLLRYGVDQSAQMGIVNASNSFSIDLFQALDGSAPRVVKNTLVRTRTNAATNVNTDGYQIGIINKFGNPNATSINDVFTLGTYFNISHQTYAQTHANQPAVSPDEEDPAAGEESVDLSSGTYGTTTYEVKIPWTVVNDNYNPNEDKTAVPDWFNFYTQLQLENSIGRGIYFFQFGLPRDTRHLPGSLSGGSTGNYSKTLYAMRYPSATGMPFGVYNFHWANYSSGYNVISRDYFVTDYYSVSDKHTVTTGYIHDIWITSGQEYADYARPTLDGAQIRINDEVGQGFRMKVTVPKTDKEIAEVGVLVAPTEVARRQHLTVGMKQIAYYNEDFTEFYGPLYEEVLDEEGKPVLNEDGSKKMQLTGWINLCDDNDKYFAASATPNDSDSFMSFDQTGGKPSGIYTVHTAVADLQKPYETNRDGSSSYVASVTGFYDDFDDFFTFYSMRPYIRYADGTVVYGEYEFKSVYYIACWLIQDMITYINGTADANKRYTMDMMPKIAATDEDGNTLKDAQGNTVYVYNTATASSMSQYYGSAERSIYQAEPRLEVFRNAAVRYLNSVNRTTYRAAQYDNFDAKYKGLVDEYVEFYEEIWKCIADCEAKVYVIEK